MIKVKSFLYQQYENAEASEKKEIDVDKALEAAQKKFKEVIEKKGDKERMDFVRQRTQPTIKHDLEQKEFPKKASSPKPTGQGQAQK